MYQEYLDKLNWRYAVQKFDPSKKLTDEQLNFLKEAIRLSPSSYGLQPWKIYIINNPEVRTQIRTAGDQPKITEASHLFAFASRLNVNETDVDKYMVDMAEKRHIPIESLAGFRKSITDTINRLTPVERDSWTARQTYIPLGFLLSACAQNNIDAGPMEGFDAEAVTKIIGADQDGYQVRALCAVGFRDSSDPTIQRAKVRFSTEKVFKEIN